MSYCTLRENTKAISTSKAAYDDDTSFRAMHVAVYFDVVQKRRWFRSERAVARGDTAARRAVASCANAAGPAPFGVA